MDALKLIKDFNPFPAVCGAICNRRCEQQCTRGLIDEPLAIDEIKKFIAEQELHEDKRYIPLCENVEGKFFTNKMAIIGAGPAGMSAAYYLRIMGYPVTIFEKEEKPGGMLVYGIPSFRLEKSVIEAEIEVLKAMGIEFKCGIEVGKDISLDDLRNEGYEAFYVAIGAQGSRKLNIPGEDNAMVESGIDFLRKVNKVEDPNLISGDVVVVGGGNVAIDVARAALRSGAQKVHLCSLEQEGEMPASPEEVLEAKEEGILLHCGWGPKEILEDSIVFKQCVSVKDETGRFNPSYDDSVLETIQCSHVLLSIGQSIIPIQGLDVD